MWTGLPAAVASPRRTSSYLGQARNAAEHAAASLAHYLQTCDSSMAAAQRSIALQAEQVADHAAAELYTCQLCAPAM